MSRYLRGLNGEEIIVAANNDLFYLNYGNETLRPQTGVEFYFLETLKAYFNFTYKLLDCNHHWGSDLGNGSWSGVIGKLQQGKAHIGLNKVSIDFDRSQVVDFSAPYVFDPITFVTMMPEHTLPPLVLFSSFTFDLWLYMSIFILLYYFICKLSKKLDLKLMIAISKGLKWSNWTVLTLFYSSNLASVVSSPKARELIDSVAQLITAAKEEKVVPIVVQGSREWALFSDSNGMFNDIGKQMLGCRRSRNGFEMLIDSVGNDKQMAIVTGQSVIRAKTKILGSHYFHFPQANDVTLLLDFYAMPIRKGLGWKHAFDVVIEKLVEAGEFKKWWRQSQNLKKLLKKQIFFFCLYLFLCFCKLNENFYT